MLIDNSMSLHTNNVVQNKQTNLEKETMELLGTMRTASEEERACINKYIVSILTNTGVNFSN